MTKLLPAFAIVIVLGAGSIARAQGQDVVYLPGGGRLRGTVEVYEPGRRVVIQLPDGTRRTLGPRQFERVQFADDPAAGTDEPAPRTTEPATSTPPASRAPAATSTPPATSAPPATPPSAAPPAGAPPPPSAPPAAATPGTGTPAVPDQQAIERMATASGAGTSAASPGTSPVRAYGDGDGDIGWAEDPATIARPAGMVHFGLQGSFTLQWFTGARTWENAGGTASRGTTFGAQMLLGGEIAGLIDFRITREFQLRALAVMGMQTAFDSEYLQATGTPYRQRQATGIFHLGARALIGLLPGSAFAFRIGGEIGFEVLTMLNAVRLYGGPLLELAIRIGDDENMEISLQIEAQNRSWHYRLDEIGRETDSFGTIWAPRASLSFAYLF